MIVDDLKAALAETGDVSGTNDASRRRLACDAAYLACRQAERGEQAKAIASMATARERLALISDPSVAASTSALLDRAGDYVRQTGAVDQGALKSAAQAADAQWSQAQQQAVTPEVIAANDAELRSFEAAQRGENPDLAYLQTRTAQAAQKVADVATAAASSARLPFLVGAGAVALLALGWVVWQVRSTWRAAGGSA